MWRESLGGWATWLGNWGQDFKRVRALEFREFRAFTHFEFKGSDPLEILTIVSRKG
jgi:hypothetical protein